MRTRIELRGAVGLEDVDGLCREFARIHSVRPGEQIELDLSALESISAAPLAVLMACLRHGHRAHGDVLTLYHPPHVDSPLAELLSAATLEEFFSDDAGCGIGLGRTPPGFGGCEPFSDGEGITRAARSLEATIREQVRLDGSSLVTVVVMISDFAENVWQHAGVDGGVAALQFDSEERHLELAVADCGVGIRQSLSRNPDYEDLVNDQEAVRAASRAGVTADPGSGGGLALYLTRLLVAENEGTLTIRSGAAKLVQTPQAVTVTRAPHLQGTLVAVRARTDRPLDYELVDQLLKRPRGADGG
jgi:hypothetical protein